MCWKIQDHCCQHILYLHWMDYCVSFYATHKYVHFTLVAVGYSLSTIGTAGILSIAVPFNIDQMIGATADELSTIIYWHCFGSPLGRSLADISNCFITDKVYQQSISIISGVAITIVMVTYYLLRHHLDTTPLLTNPVKLIVKVLNYARKNKYPRNRSALTYWEESAPSRLDLGKDKYGGPFTEEEVEDVKTFFKYLPQQKQPYNTSAHNPVYYIRRSPSMLVVTEYRLDERSDFNG